MKSKEVKKMTKQNNRLLALSVGTAIFCSVSCSSVPKKDTNTAAANPASKNATRSLASLSAASAEGFQNEVDQFDADATEVSAAKAAKFYFNIALKVAENALNPSMSFADKKSYLMTYLAYGKREIDKQTEKKGAIVYPVLTAAHEEVSNLVNNNQFEAVADTIKTSVTWSKQALGIF